MKPKILRPELSHDFHDSELISINISSNLTEITVVLSNYYESSKTRLWRIKFTGVLRFEYETLGEGDSNDYDFPIQIYDVYQEDSSSEKIRWLNRLKILSIPSEDASNISHVTLASSFIRGWGKNEELEGISIICRKVKIDELN